MSKLISDYAQVEISNKVKDILRIYHSSSWHSEPYHQNQNHSEWRYSTIKTWTNTIPKRTGAPPNCWLCCMSYICYLVNHISCGSLKGQIDLTKLNGVTPDVSIIMMHNFPSEEKHAFWVGFSEHVADGITCKLLDSSSRNIIYGISSMLSQ